MACAGIGGLERRVDVFLKFDAERGSSIFSVSGGRGGGMAFYEDAGIHRTFEKEGFGSRSMLAGWLYRIQSEGIEESDLHTQLVLEA